MKILITGAAGFIGFHTSKLLLEQGHEVVGLDNINDYYQTSLKFDRLAQLGIAKEAAEVYGEIASSEKYSNFKFLKANLEDRVVLPELFKKEGFDTVCNLAAQAGVRYSLENPESYIDSNIVGFLNILECCRHNNIDHLVYASSSSVYGTNEKIPFSTNDRVDNPISLYAASKKSNELMAHTYSHLFGMHTTGLRFFTVYGPWGRPDMALFLFTDAIVKDEPIQVFNHGKMERDFTYIDDIVQGITRILLSGTEKRSDKYKVYNIGNNNSVQLMDFIEAIEKNLGKTAEKQLLPIQPGDVERTWADVDDLIRDYGYRPDTDVRDGIREFIKWFQEYYKV